MNIPVQPDLSTQQLRLGDIEALIKSGGDLYAGHLNDIKLTSCFQPIYSLSHQRIVGFEGLVRAHLSDGEMLSPLSLFAMARSEQESVLQDRLCRTLHIKNFIDQSDNNHWLFLNINPLVTVRGKQYGAFFGELLQHYGIAPQRIVIEILEGQIDDEYMLAEAVSYYKSIGCLIAIDDFGAGHSNFERIWTLRPHIVKLDRSIIVQAATDKTIRRIVPSLVSLMHEAGSLVLMEGIETEKQALIAMDADVDFVQGYYFGKPQAQLPGFDYHPVINHLFKVFKDGSVKEEAEHTHLLKTYTEAFQETARRIAAGIEPAIAAHAFLALPAVDRCYLLNEEGIQLGENLLPPSAVLTPDPRFEPLKDATNAIWSRRHYFQKAVREPDIIHVSNPYLSITGGTLCVTLSVAITHVTGALVLCGDIQWIDS